MEQSFKKIIEHIFNNWTALRLAVDHGIAGPDSKKIALEFMDYMVQYCLYESNVDADSIQEALDDVMDQEYDTICEDGSTKEIAIILNKFLQLIKEGNVALVEEEYLKLPTSNEWLVKSQSVMETSTSDNQIDQENLTEEASSSEVSMEQDSEWTQVKSRRKR